MVDESIVEREQRRGALKSSPARTARSNVGPSITSNRVCSQSSCAANADSRHRPDVGKRGPLDVADVMVENNRAAGADSCDTLQLDQPQRRISRGSCRQVFANHASVEIAIESTNRVRIEVLALIQPSARPLRDGMRNARDVRRCRAQQGLRRSDDRLVANVVRPVATFDARPHVGQDGPRINPGVEVMDCGADVFRFAVDQRPEVRARRRDSTATVRDGY